MWGQFQNLIIKPSSTFWLELYVSNFLFCDSFLYSQQSGYGTKNVKFLLSTFIKFIVLHIYFAPQMLLPVLAASA